MRMNGGGDATQVGGVNYVTLRRRVCFSAAILWHAGFPTGQSQHVFSGSWCCDWPVRKLPSYKMADRSLQ